MKEMLRKMEQDVSFYNNVKKAIIDKERLEKEIFGDDDDSNFGGLSMDGQSTRSSNSFRSSLLEELEQISNDSFEGSIMSFNQARNRKDNDGSQKSHIGKQQKNKLLIPLPPHSSLKSLSTLKTEAESDASAGASYYFEDGLPSQSQKFLVRPRSQEYE